MNQALTDLAHALTDTSLPVTMADVEALGSEYPFFTLPAVMMLQRGGETLTEAEKTMLLSRIALNAPDAATLVMLSDPACSEYASFYPPVRPREVTTDDVITTFLNTYGHSDPAEDALLERLIFNPTPDYSTLLSMEEEESIPEPVDPSDTSNDALINAFILGHKDGSRILAPDASDAPVDEAAAGSHEAPAAPGPVVREVAAAPAPADTSLTESLAKIYIRQKRYDKAFEIIHTLSLNNPKKSAYFADQLRFLKKLMLNRGMANNSK